MQQTKVVIETLIAWQKRFLKSQVPFSDTGSRVTVLLKQLGDRQFVRMNS